MAVHQQDYIEDSSKEVEPKVTLSETPYSADSTEGSVTGKDMLESMRATNKQHYGRQLNVAGNLKESLKESQSQAIQPEGSASGTQISATGIERQVPDEFKADNYADVIKWLEARRDKFKPLSKEELAKLRRRQKIEGIISGVSDAARSIANMIAVHHYAPNMYDGGNSMSARAQARFDKDKAEREANEDKYFNYAMMIGKLKDQDKDNRMNIFKMNYQMSRDALQDAIREAAEKRAQAKADRDDKMAALRYEISLGKLSEQQAKAREAEIQAEYAEQMQQAELAVKGSVVQKNKAQAKRAERLPVGGGRSSGGGSGSSGGGNSAGGSTNAVWCAIDDDGVVHYFTARSEAQAHSYSGGNGWTLIGSTTQSSTSNDNGFGLKTSSTTTSKRTTNVVRPNKSTTIEPRFTLFPTSKPKSGKKSPTAK